MDDRPIQADIGSAEFMSPVSFMLKRAAQLSADLFAEQLGKTGLTQRQYTLLETVLSNEGASQTDLVRTTGIDRSTLADLVNRLETQTTCLVVRRSRSTRFSDSHRGMASVRVNRFCARLVVPVLGFELYVPAILGPARYAEEVHAVAVVCLPFDREVSQRAPLKLRTHPQRFVNRPVVGERVASNRVDAQGRELLGQRLTIVKRPSKVASTIEVSTPGEIAPEADPQRREYN